MAIQLRTKLATIIRRYNQGFLTESEAYHAVCNLYAETDHGSD